MSTKRTAWIFGAGIACMAALFAATVLTCGSGQADERESERALAAIAADAWTFHGTAAAILGTAE